MNIDEIKRNAPRGAEYYTDQRMDHKYLIKSAMNGKWCGSFDAYNGNVWIELKNQEVGIPVLIKNL